MCARNQEGPSFMSKRFPSPVATFTTSGYTVMVNEGLDRMVSAGVLRGGEIFFCIRAFLHVPRKTPFCWDPQGQHWRRGLFPPRIPEHARKRFIQHVHVVPPSGADNPASTKFQTPRTHKIPTKYGHRCFSGGVSGASFTFV